MQQKKKYYPELDIVKGIAIILVMLGHSFCTNPINLFEQFQFTGDVVRSFQMPLFFIASGFLFSEKESWASFIKKKTIRLLFTILCIFRCGCNIKDDFCLHN